MKFRARRSSRYNRDENNPRRETLRKVRFDILQRGADEAAGFLGGAVAGGVGAVATGLGSVTGAVAGVMGGAVASAGMEALKARRSPPATATSFAGVVAELASVRRTVRELGARVPLLAASVRSADQQLRQLASSTRSAELEEALGAMEIRRLHLEEGLLRLVGIESDLDDYLARRAER